MAVRWFLAPPLSDVPDAATMGSLCAYQGECFGGAHPMGAYYWFSLPFSYGWPLAALLILNIALFLWTAWLSVGALLPLLPGRLLRTQPALRLSLLLFAVNLALQGLWLQGQLLDISTAVPASCFFLSGIWLLLLAHHRPSAYGRAKRAAIAGICLGLSAWMHALYLLPSLVVAVFAFLWLRRHGQAVWVLLALLPVSIQFHEASQHYDRFTYIDVRALPAVAVASVEIAESQDAAQSAAAAEPLEATEKPPRIPRVAGPLEQALWSAIAPIHPQCCDSASYVAMGEDCALRGTCFGDIRPMGVHYWFSVPHRLDLPINALVLMNWLSLLGSVLLSTLALQHLLSRRPSIGVWLPLAAASLGIHIFFLYPTLFHTLTDTPAACFFLMGGWLLLWLELKPAVTDRVDRRSLYAGLCLGSAALLRAFYLYPVMLAVVIYLLGVCRQKPGSISRLGISAALVMIAMQYGMAWRAYGKFTYVDPRADEIMSVHASPVIGYDTIFPYNATWTGTQSCTAFYGVIEGIKQGEYAQVACLLKQRLRFYLGSYEANTYFFSPAVNTLPLLMAAEGDPDGWWLNSMQQQTAVEAPDGTRTAQKFTADTTPEAVPGIFRPVMLREHTPYTFSAWLWSPRPLLLEMGIVRTADHVEIAHRRLALTDKPMRYSVTGSTVEDMHYVPLTLGTEDMKYQVMLRPLPDEDNNSPAATFSLWHAQLEVGNQASDYHPYESPLPAEIRADRPWWYWLNMAVLVLAGLGIILQWRHWLSSGAGLSLLFAHAASAAACLAIIPEQRFAVAFMILVWLLALTSLASIVKRLVVRVPTSPHP